jgi:hypothetical protein
VAAFPGFEWDVVREPATGRYRIDVFRDPHVRWSLGVPNPTSHAWRSRRTPPGDLTVRHRQMKTGGP